MKSVGKIVLAGVILMVLFVGGCIALVGGIGSEIEKDLNEQQQESSITLKEFKGVEMGALRKDLEKEFGEPSDVQEQTIEGTQMDCIYYNNADGEFMDTFQFCFTDGVLDSKSRY